MPDFSRLTTLGPGQLEDWGVMPAEELIAGTGQQFGHLWLDDAATGLMVGVWACSPMTGKMGPWSTNEVMVLIEGSVAIDHEDGSCLNVTAGEAFFIPKGTVCSWRQEGDLRKFFVIHSDGSGLKPSDPSALRATKIDFAMSLSPCDGPSAAMLLTDAPNCEAEDVFTDLTGQLTAGVWASTPYQRKAVPAPHHELMHIIEGTATLYDGAGREETFSAGDTMFMPKGSVTGWKSSTNVRKLYCIFAPR